MKALFGTWFLMLFMAQLSLAQHCQYDHAELIGIRPVDADNHVIEGLRITLVNPEGEPIIVGKSIFKRDKYVSSYQDTAEFWRNPAPNKDIYHKTREEQKRHFIQAGSDYILISQNHRKEV